MLPAEGYREYVLIAYLSTTATSGKVAVISGIRGPFGPSGLEVVITVGNLKYFASYGKLC